MNCLDCGKELTTADPLGHWLCRECEQKRKTPPAPMMYGWICPRCGKVHSPYSTVCDCIPPSTTSTTIPLP